MKDNDLQVQKQIVVPIISEGDCYGAVIILDGNKATDINSNDIKIAELGAVFLAKQFEI